MNRGLAYPDVEPWGSFAVDYCRAERGIDGAISSAQALRTQVIVEQMQRRMEWERSQGELVNLDDAPPMPSVEDMMWLERLRISRFPEDYGTSKHRKPEAPHDAQEWLDANSMDREQLAALLSDPPDAIRAALVDAAPAVYAILVAGGFDPSAQKDVAKPETSG